MHIIVDSRERIIGFLEGEFQFPLPLVGVFIMDFTPTRPQIFTTAEVLSGLIPREPPPVSIRFFPKLILYDDKRAGEVWPDDQQGGKVSYVALQTNDRIDGLYGIRALDPRDRLIRPPARQIIDQESRIFENAIHAIGCSWNWEKQNREK